MTYCRVKNLYVLKAAIVANDKTVKDFGSADKED